MSDLTIEILGSGGAYTIPLPLCQCRVCSEARQKGGVYARKGPCVFIHGPNILFDTPEEIKDMLNRSDIKDIQACFYSHWHPDHTAGKRVWEMNRNERKGGVVRTTPVYIPQQVAEDFKVRMAINDHLELLDRRELISLRRMTDGDQATIGQTMVKPFRLAEKYVYGFDIRINKKFILVLMDELFEWQPQIEHENADIVILPAGIFEFHPLTGERQLPADHKLFKSEATHIQTLEMIHKMKPKQVIFMHIEEGDKLGFDELKLYEQKLVEQGIPACFSYDTMKISL